MPSHKRGSRSGWHTMLGALGPHAAQRGSGAGAPSTLTESGVMQVCRAGFDDEHGDGRVLREPCSQDEAGGLPIASALVCDRVCGTRTPPPATCYQIVPARKNDHRGSPQMM
jgi:hypothetical protein